MSNARIFSWLDWPSSAVSLNGITVKTLKWSSACFTPVLSMCISKKNWYIISLQLSFFYSRPFSLPYLMRLIFIEPWWCKSNQEWIFVRFAFGFRYFTWTFHEISLRLLKKEPWPFWACNRTECVTFGWYLVHCNDARNIVWSLNIQTISWTEQRR